jgi:hypothetical protein
MFSPALSCSLSVFSLIEAGDGISSIHSNDSGLLTFTQGFPWFSKVFAREGAEEGRKEGREKGCGGCEGVCVCVCVHIVHSKCSKTSL